MEEMPHVCWRLCVVTFVLINVCTASVTPDYSNSCQEPADFPNGMTSVSHSPKVIHYSCHPGYTLDGPLKQQCTREGMWEPPQIPICILNHLNCKKLFLVNGNVKYTTYSPGNQEVTIQCHDGYALPLDTTFVNQLKLQCSQDGKWTTSNGWVINPECSERICNTPPSVPNSNVGYSEVGLYPFSGVMNEQEAYYKCKAGFTLVNPNDDHLYCRNGEWEGSTPSCVAVRSCEHPEKIANGHILPLILGDSYNFQQGSKVTYKCDPGFKLIGSSTLLCLGQDWSHHAPSCIPDEESTQYCPSISMISNGHCFCETKSDVAYCEPFYPGLHVECVCNEGYQLVGESIVTCKPGGRWDFEMPSCAYALVIPVDSKSSDSSSQSHMSTLAIVVATACSVLGVLLLIMVIMVFRRRKPHPPRLCRPSSTPPPYSRVHSNSMDEHDRMLLIGYENNQIALPSYEEATTGRPQHAGHFAQRSGSGQVGEYRPLPSIPSNLRSGQSGSGDISNRHSIITTSTMNRDGISEVFGSIDTVNVSMSDASTAVTVETLDSASSHHSNISRRGTAGSINSSNGSLYTEDVPLLESNQRDVEIDTGSPNEEDVQDKQEN